MTSHLAYVSAIRAHYSKNWGQVLEEHSWGRGPRSDLPDEFRILVFRRTPTVDAYCTQCMSLPSDAERLELHILTRASKTVNADVVEILTAIAHYHRSGHHLGLNHTVNFGRPLVRGGSCHYGLLSLPYLDGPELEWLDTLMVRFLWVVPITSAELQFKKVEGVEALEEVFEERGLDYLNFCRLSLV